MSAMANKQEYLNRLKERIQELHHCKAVHKRTVAVDEASNGKTLWKGEVEVFWLTGNPHAKRCYAWSGPPAESGQDLVMAVLEVPPVIGPATAVRSALSEDAQCPS
jgi:hypothetical protein